MPSRESIQLGGIASKKKLESAAFVASENLNDLGIIECVGDWRMIDRYLGVGERTSMMKDRSNSLKTS